MSRGRIVGTDRASGRRRGERVRRSRAQWREVFAAHEGSGLSVMGFCLAQGIAPSVFYRARARLARAKAAGLFPEARGRVERVKDGAAFMEWRVETPALAGGLSAGVEIVLADGTRIVLCRGFDAETFVRALAAFASRGQGAFASADSILRRGQADSQPWGEKRPGHAESSNISSHLRVPRGVRHAPVVRHPGAPG